MAFKKKNRNEDDSTPQESSGVATVASQREQKSAFEEVSTFKYDFRLEREQRERTEAWRARLSRV